MYFKQITVFHFFLIMKKSVHIHAQIDRINRKPLYDGAYFLRLCVRGIVDQWLVSGHQKKIRKRSFTPSNMEVKKVAAFSNVKDIQSENSLFSDFLHSQGDCFYLLLNLNCFYFQGVKQNLFYSYIYRNNIYIYIYIKGCPLLVFIPSLNVTPITITLSKNDLI